MKVVQEYIKAHPDMIKHPQVLAQAADEVSRGDHGYPEHSLAYFDLVKANFEDRMRNEPPPEEPVKPKHKPEVSLRNGSAVVAGDIDEPHRGDRSAFGYASRDRVVGNSAMDRYWFGGGEDRPGKVTLSIAQKEAARIAGISEKEYAEQVLRLREEKANGHYGGAP